MSNPEKISEFLRSYSGLIALIIVYEFIVVLFLATFSGPMVDRFGDVPILEYIFPLIKGLSDARHEERAILIYHALATPFLVAVVFFFMDWFETRPSIEPHAKWTLFIGSMTVSISAMIFAYFSENWIWHGLFIAGQSVTFYGAILFVVTIWPTKNFPSNEENPDAIVLGRNWEYVNLATTSIAIMISAIIAAIAASNFGRTDPNYPNVTEPVYNRHTGEVTYENISTLVPRLMETIVRRENNNAGWTYYEMIVSHLHIMVALLAAAVLLLTIRFAKMEGIWFKISQIVFTPGVIILSVGAWLVITPWDGAHKVINVGAGLLLIVGIITAVYGWIGISKEQLGDKFTDASAAEKTIAIFKDPVKLGLYFQLIWVNVVSTVPGIYVGINLAKFRDEAFIEGGGQYTGNEPYWAIEYSFNVGHWHILATLIAIMVTFIAIDYYGLKGKARQIAGWTLTLGTILGFGFATKYMLRSPGADYELDFIFIDVGLALLFIGLGVLVVYLLYDYLLGRKEK